MDLAQKLIESLKTTLLGMGIVIGTLYILSLILDLMRYIFYRPQQEVKKNEISNEINVVSNTIEDDQPNMMSDSIEIDDQENDLELVAVISAALSSYLKVPVSQIKIGSIRQIHKTTPAWGMAARYEISNNRI